MKTITAILVLLAGASCNRNREASQAMYKKLDAIERAITLFEIDRDRLPANLHELLPSTNEWGGGAAAGYIKPDGIMDSWGNAMQYEVHTHGYLIRSAGRDGSFRTQDDIVRTKTR